jgi:hypothetical protein
VLPYAALSCHPDRRPAARGRAPRSELTSTRTPFLFTYTSKARLQDAQAAHDMASHPPHRPWLVSNTCGHKTTAVVSSHPNLQGSLFLLLLGLVHDVVPPRTAITANRMIDTHHGPSAPPSDRHQYITRPECRATYRPPFRSPLLSRSSRDYPQSPF